MGASALAAAVLYCKDAPMSVSFKEIRDALEFVSLVLQRPLVIGQTKAYVHGICLEGLMAEQRHVRLFRNGRNQAVRIPVEFELPGDEAIMHRDGDRLVIEPVRKRGLVALLKTMKPMDEDFPEVDDPVPAPESVL
jgi:antitoxin VapB